MDENVLVVPRALFDKLGSFQGINLEVDRYLPHFLSTANNLFLRRGEAENDPSFKQIIPYAVLVHEGKILHYVRGGKSGEKRLVAKGSIGIGGHINDTDEGLFSMNEQTYKQAVEREVNEELRLGTTFSDRMVALINDDETEVGRVHLGVVHIFTLEKQAVKAGESAITKLEFLTIEELQERHDSLETWSQILLKALPSLIG
ncbi:MAG: hypothetical protein ABI443_11010 [Chthoniobacterales bacterium]